MKGLAPDYYFQLKGSVPLIQAVEKAYNLLPDEFSGYDLYRKAMMFYMRPGVYIDTILRRLRHLKALGKIDYKCTNWLESKYKKV